MSSRRSGIPFLGALGVTLTTLAVGYYTYKYFRTQGTKRRSADSNHATQPPTQTNNGVPQPQLLDEQNTVPPPQLSAQNDVPSVQPAIQNNDPSLQQPVQNYLSRLQSAIENPPPLQTALRNNGTPLQPPSYNNVPAVQPDFGPPSLQIANSLQPTSQNNAPPLHTAIQNNGQPLHPPSYHNVPALQPPTLVLNFGQPSQNTNATSPREQRMSRRDYEALPPEDRPHREVRTSFPPANGANIHPCKVSMASSTSDIILTLIPESMENNAIQLAMQHDYEQTVSLLRWSPDPQITVSVDLLNMAPSMYLDLVGNALTRLASDDAHNRCKTLNVRLPSRGEHVYRLSSIYNESVSLTIPQIETLFWRSDQQDIPMMNPATLTHLTNLTLRTRITYRDCHYILGCIQNTVQHFDARTLYESHATSILPNPYSDKKKSDPVLRQLESLSIVATSSPEGFLNNLRLYGGKLKTLTIEVPNHLIDPKAMKFIPWAVIDNISLKCNFVNGGANWVTSNAVHAASMGGLQLQPPSWGDNQ